MRQRLHVEPTPGGVVSRLLPLLAVGALLAGCSERNQPLAPKSVKPRFSQVPGNGPEKITFQSNRTGNVDVFVMNPDGSGVTQLTFSSAFDFLPLFSPDGSRILIGKCEFICQVVVINADGSGERVVLDNGFPGTWSPDGNRIALAGVGGGLEGVYVINADGSGLVRVAEPQNVTDWSPDGRQLMLDNDSDGDTELYVMNLDGSGVTKLTDNNASDYPGRGAAWSPDGTRILFSSDRGGAGSDIYVMNADGTGVTQLTPNDGFNEGDPVWSPDATHIAFESNRAGDSHIFVMNADGSGITQLTFGVGVNNNAPHWIRQISPSNDDFVNAAGISALPFSANVNLPLATVETGEPAPTCSNPFGGVGKTVWYSFTPAQTGSISASTFNASVSSVVAAYSGTSLASLTEIGCGVFGNRATFRALANTTYYFQLGGLFGQSGSLEFRLEVTPPPVANFFFFPSDASVFDAIQFFDQSFDAGGVGFAPQAWTFGDGQTGTGFNATHRYAADGDYTVQLAVTTLDGRAALASQAVHVLTHDVAITRFSAPNAASSGQTRRIVVGLSSKRYPETVQVQLFKSVPGGFESVGTLIQSVPVRTGGRTTDFSFSYTFTADDAVVGKVTFKADAFILNARDALPADNEAIATRTTVSR